MVREGTPITSANPGHASKLPRVISHLLGAVVTRSPNASVSSARVRGPAAPAPAASHLASLSRQKPSHQSRLSGLCHGEVQGGGAEANTPRGTST